MNEMTTRRPCPAASPPTGADDEALGRRLEVPRARRCRRRATSAMSSSMALSTSSSTGSTTSTAIATVPVERRRRRGRARARRRSASGTAPRGQAVRVERRRARDVVAVTRPTVPAGCRVGRRVAPAPDGSVGAVRRSVVRPVAARPASTSSASATPSSTSSPTPATTFLAEHGLVKGSMTLIDTDRARRTCTGRSARRSR